jgi:dolichyl-phosphate beta-glucosyltransferase
MKPFISVVLPNYNELENLHRGVLSDIANYFAKQSYTWEVIISDDGSTDKSIKYIEDFSKAHPGFHLLKNAHAGKPFALRSGAQIAKGEYVLFTDMDQSTPIDQLDKLIPYTKDGFKVIIGSRGIRRRDSSLFRHFASVVFLLARKIFLLRSIKDTQCGFKLFDTKLAREIFAHMRIFGRARRTAGWKVTAYDVEMLFLAELFGHEIQEVPVVWRDEDTSSGKKRDFLKESIEMFLEILRVRANYMLGKYHV